MLSGAAARRVALLAGKGEPGMERLPSNAIQYSKTPGPNTIKHDLHTGIQQQR